MMRLLVRGLTHGWPVWCYIVGHRTDGRRRVTARDLARAVGLLPVPCDRCGVTYWTVPS